MPDCPTDADLTGFLNESLPPEQATQLSAHVESCPICQSKLDKLTPETGAYPPVRASDVVSTPDAGTLVIGVPPLPIISRSSALPLIPGFDVLEEIGRGGMGVVYKARHRRLNRLVALKMILAGGAADAHTVQRFLFEAEVLARVQHPQVVQVFEVDTYQGTSGVLIPYLAMELLEGGSLTRRLREKKLDPHAAAALVEGIAHAVHAAHSQGIIHRDLKPGNILFASAEVAPRSDELRAPPPAAPESTGSEPRLPGSALLPKVTDFGLAKFTESAAEFTGTGQVVGTPHYMAPEQAAGNKKVGPPADVYALGAILFECLTGRPPFEGAEPMSVLLKVVSETPPDVRTVRPDVPRDLAAVIARCLARDTRRRYATAAELAEDLARFQASRPTVARPLRRRERLWLWVKRNPAVAGLVALLAAVVVVAFTMVTWLWLHAEQTAHDERIAKETARFAEDRATRAAAEAIAQRANADRRQAELEFARAISCCEEGRIEEGLELFVRAVELAELTGEADLARAARINLAAWPRELPPPHKSFAHTAQPRAVAFHPDGVRMATVGNRSEIYLWEIATGQKVMFKPTTVLAAFDEIVTAPTYRSVAISPDGNTIAAGSSNGRVTLWDTKLPDQPTTFEVAGRNENIWAIAFASDGTLVTNDGQLGLKRWDVRDRQKPVLVAQGMPKQPKSADFINVLAVSPDGTRVYTGDRNGLVRAWDTDKLTELRTWQSNGWVQDLAVSPDGSLIAVTGPEGVVRMFAANGGKEPLEITLAGAYGNGVAFAPKRPYLATSDADGNVRFWHIGTGQPIGLPMRFSGDVSRVRFGPDSDDFAVLAGNAVYLCKSPDPPGDLVFAGQGSRLRGLDFSPNGDYLVATDELTLRKFDLRARQTLRASDHAGPGPLTLRYDPDPKRPWLYRGHRNGFDRVPMPDGRKAVPGPAFGLDRVYGIEFVRNASGLVLITGGKVVRYDAATLELKVAIGSELDIPAGTELSALAVRPDGEEVMVAFGNRVAFLHPDTLAITRPGWAAHDEIRDARYSRDGKGVFVARRDNVAELLDAATGNPSRARQMSHARAVTVIAVSPDGSAVLTGSRDSTARFWDAVSGLPLGPPLRHLGPVTHARYSPDGEHVATGTGTGHVMLWDVPPKAATGTPDALRVALRKSK